MTDPKTQSHLSDPARQGRITASLVGAILGLSPYMTRDDAMRVMVREALGAEREFQGNIATDYGNQNEEGAVIEFRMETGLDVVKYGDDQKFMTREDWAGCSPDGLCSDKAGLEVKCPFGLRKAEKPVPFKTLAEQEHYYAQVQFSLWVTDWPAWHFFQWCPVDTALEPVYPDLEWQADNLPILRQFYAEFLHELANNADEYLAPKRVTIDTPEAAKMMREWDDLTEQAERVKERKADLLDSIVAMAGKKDALFSGRKLTLVQKEGSVSYARAVKELLPDADLTKYRGKPSSFWKVT